MNIDNVEIANVLHDALLRELTRLAPTGSGRSISTGSIASAMIVLLAELLVASRPEFPAEELERLSALFERRLREEYCARAGAVGHA